MVKTEVLEVNANCPSKDTESEVIELSSDEEDEDDELTRCMARVAELKIAKRKREEQALVGEQAKKIKLELEDSVAATTGENLGRQESLRLYRLRMKALQFPAKKPVVRVFQDIFGRSKLSKPSKFLIYNFKCAGRHREPTGDQWIG